MIRDEEAFESQPSADPDGRIRSTGSVRWDPLLSADEERELADRIKGGDQAARRQLILANLRVVVEIARGFRSSKVPLDDLIQEGNLGLIRASEDFDPSVHGCRFYTYAEVWIRAFIHRALIANDSLIRVPQHVFLQRKQYRRLGNAKRCAGVADDGAAEAGAMRASRRSLGRSGPLHSGSIRTSQRSAGVPLAPSSPRRARSCRSPTRSSMVIRRTSRWPTTSSASCSRSPCTD